MHVCSLLMNLLLFLLSANANPNFSNIQYLSWVFILIFSFSLTPILYSRDFILPMCHHNVWVPITFPLSVKCNLSLFTISSNMVKYLTFPKWSTIYRSHFLWFLNLLGQLFACQSLLNENETNILIYFVLLKFNFWIEKLILSLWKLLCIWFFFLLFSRSWYWSPSDVCWSLVVCFSFVNRILT